MKAIRKAFSAYDTLQCGVIALTRLATVLRALGLNPTEAQLRDAVSWLDSAALVRFNEFLVIMGRCLRAPITEQQVLEVTSR